MTTTDHGDNLASQINGEDAYGMSGTLTAADPWTILDTLHTHWMEAGDDKLVDLAQSFYQQLEAAYPDEELRGY